MYKNFTFESTQSRGTRILKALGDLTWGEMPEDGIFLKEIEAPVVATKEDAPPIEKPNIKSTLRQFWELREESCEDENSNLSKKVDEMEIERQMVEEYPPQEEARPMEILYKKQTPINYEYENSDFYAEAPQPVTERKNVKIVRRMENDQNQNHRIHSQSQMSQQNAEYLSKLQKAMPEPKLIKGKSKHSQKYGYGGASSSTFFHKKKAADSSNMTQMSQWNTINEDIDDDLEIPEDEVYRKQGTKKLRLEVNAETTRREEAHKMLDTIDGKDSLTRDKDNGNGRERGLQDLLERAVRRASNQLVTRWLIKVVSYKTTKGIHTVEFLCVQPQPDGNTTSYAVINPGKQYYGQNIVPDKRYYFVNPRPIIQQEINNKKVYYVDKIEEV